VAERVLLVLIDDDEFGGDKAMSNPKLRAEVHALSVVSGFERVIRLKPTGGNDACLMSLG